MTSLRVLMQLCGLVLIAVLAMFAGAFSSPSDQHGWGNVGDPYEGHSPDEKPVLLSSCGELSGDASYRLTRNVGSSQICFTLAGPNITLDLGGYAVDGTISYKHEGWQPDGLVIFNGTVECASQNGACIDIEADRSQLRQGIRFHHLTLRNSAVQGSALSVNWDGSGPGVKLNNITASGTAESSKNSRTDLLSVTGRGQQSAEFSYNDLSCPDTRSCEAIICYSLRSCRIHHNRIVMDSSGSDEPGRAILIDGDTGGIPHAMNQFADVFDNDITANNCRAIRVRNAQHTRIHHNTIRAITGSGANYTAAFHWGDPDKGSVDLQLDAYNNSFEVNGGTVLMIRDGYNASLRDSTITGSKGSLAAVRTSGGIAKLTLLRNANELPPVPIRLEPGTFASVCRSGKASGGTVTETRC